MPTDLGDFLKKSTGHVFASKPRFDSSVLVNGGGSSLNFKNMGESTSKDMLDIPGPKFNQDERRGVGGAGGIQKEIEIEVEVLPETESQRLEQEYRRSQGLPPVMTTVLAPAPEASDAVPGPGTYELTRFGDVPKNAPATTKRRPEPSDVLMKIRREEYINPGLAKNNKVELSAKVVFGYGCNLQEHVMYGMCLDGMCGRRGGHEHTILLTDDEMRLTGTMGLKNNLQMLEETPDELRAKELQEKKEKMQEVQEQLGSTLKLLPSAKTVDDGLEGHRHMQMMRDLEGPSEIEEG